MSTSYMSVDVKCPFYKGDDGKKLICEGIEDKCNIHHQFENKAGKIKRMEKYCTKNFAKCRLYQILDEKYNK